MVERIKESTNKTELQRFLSMLTYIRKFIKNLSEKIATLRNLLIKESIWNWNKKYGKIFKNLKNELKNSFVFRFYNT